MTLLSPTHAAAAQALVAQLSYQSGHAQDEALGFPDDVAAAIAGHAADKVNGAQAIRDELARLYDRRRDGHVRQVEAQIAHNQHVLAARIVIERQEGCSPDDSIEAVGNLNDEELAEIAALASDPDNRAAVDAVFARASARLQIAEPAAQPPAEEPVPGPTHLPDDKLEI